MYKHKTCYINDVGLKLQPSSNPLLHRFFFFFEWGAIDFWHYISFLSYLTVDINILKSCLLIFLFFYQLFPVTCNHMRHTQSPLDIFCRLKLFTWAMLLKVFAYGKHHQNLAVSYQIQGILSIPGNYYLYKSYCILSLDKIASYPKQKFKFFI